MKLVNTKQYYVVVFLMMMAQKLFLLPALMIKTGGRDSYMSMFMILLLEVLVIVMITIVTKMHKNYTFYDLLSKGTKPVIGKIIAGIMVLGLLLKIILVISELRVFFDVNLNEALPDWAAMLPFCAFLFLIGVKTLRGLARLSQLFAPLILVSILILLVLVIGNTYPHWLLPFLANGIKPVFKNIYLYPVWFADVSYLLIFIGNVKPSKRMLLFSTISSVVAAIFVFIFTAAMFATYSSIPDLLDYGNNISNMLLYSPSSYVYGRFDILIFSIWVFTLFIQAGLIFYLLTRNIKYITGANGNKLISGISAAVLYIIVVFIFHDEHDLYRFCLHFPRLFTVFNNYAVPLLIFILALILKKKSKNEGKQSMLSSIKPNFATKIKAGKIE
jgi:spore germination protein KB